MPAISSRVFVTVAPKGSWVPLSADLVLGCGIGWQRRRALRFGKGGAHRNGRALRR